MSACRRFGRQPPLATSAHACEPGRLVLAAGARVHRRRPAPLGLIICSAVPAAAKVMIRAGLARPRRTRPPRADTIYSHCRRRQTINHFPRRSLADCQCWLPFSPKLPLKRQRPPQKWLHNNITAPAKGAPLASGFLSKSKPMWIVMQLRACSALGWGGATHVDISWPILGLSIPIRPRAAATKNEEAAPWLLARPPSSLQECLPTPIPELGVNGGAE